MPIQAVNDAASTDANVALTYNVLANDATDAGTTLIAATLPDPVDGALAFTAGGAVTFTPNAATFQSLGIGQSTVVPITYTIGSGATQSSAVFSVTVNGVNDPPVGQPDSATVAAEQSVTIDVLANDTDPDATDMYDTNGNLILGVASFTQPVDANGNQLGTLQYAAGPAGHPVFVYTANDSSLDTGTHTVTFTYTASDQWGAPLNGVSAPTTVTITITGNSVAGDTVQGNNHPNLITPDSVNPQIHNHLLGNDNISGGNNRDTIDGGAGADTIHGDNGADSLIGGAGDDLVFGDNGKDTIDGGAGDDTLTGGEGNDRFVFGYHFGHDVVTDFRGGRFEDDDEGHGHGHARDDDHSHGHHSEFEAGDVIQVHPAEWGSFDDLMGHAVQDGTSVVITSDDGADTLTLLHTRLSDLHSQDFLFI